MATSKQLDQQGETVKLMYKKLTDEAKTYNDRRRKQTKALRAALTPVWRALEAGKTVNGHDTKLEWCKWANPNAKHPERYFYMVMNDKRLKSLQPKKKSFNALDYVKVDRTTTVMIGKDRYSVMGIAVTQDKKIARKYSIVLDAMLHDTHIMQNYGPACKTPDSRKPWFKADHYSYAKRGEEPSCQSCQRALENLTAHAAAA